MNFLSLPQNISIWSILIFLKFWQTVDLIHLNNVIWSWGFDKWINWIQSTLASKWIKVFFHLKIWDVFIKLIHFDISAILKKIWIDPLEKHNMILDQGVSKSGSIWYNRLLRPSGSNAFLQLRCFYKIDPFWNSNWTNVKSTLWFRCRGWYRINS